jgi:cysteine desulfurase
VGSLARSYGAVVHVDAVQAVGKIPLDLQRLPVDLLTLSGHKLHAPKGIGALYVRRGLRFRPLLLGGHQERGRRAGTENVPGIIALGKAAELAPSPPGGSP